ncbi:MAG: ergothioneine biosynthesis protein EgtB [Reyranellaceae bacterium]
MSDQQTLSGRVVESPGAERFSTVREYTERLADPLSPEDQTVQSMPDASPTKWHLAHTTWFFATFVLKPHAARFQPFDPAYEYLFNSYYEAVGPRHPRPQRGMITRPGVEEILAFRRFVSEEVVKLLQSSDNRIGPLVELGLHHEQQHQELILMDAKHLLSLNPLHPSYSAAAPALAAQQSAMGWCEFAGGLREIGHAGPGFAFDNEGPRHRVWLEPFAVANRPVTCGDYLAFIADGGYRRAEFWLSAGWDCVNQRGWQAPLYWQKDGAGWQVFTLHGMKPVDPAEPVCHVSAFEAAAYAKWAGKRLPREEEWEVAASSLNGVGEVWEWTASPYIAYPGYREPAGAIGEYNGKFMANQMVLRGGCAFTPPDHVRPTYRNFFPSDARWMFGGLRLAKDLR